MLNLFFSWPGDHILHSNINASFPLMSRTTRDDLRGMKHNGDSFVSHAVNNDESDSEDKMCFSQNKMPSSNQSNDMDLTEPLHGTLLNLRQTGLLDNETGVTELLKSHFGHQQNWDSELSSAFYQKLDTTEEIDMTLTGTIPHVHIKAHKKSEENFRNCVTKPDFSMPVSSRKEVDELNQNQTYNAKISSQNHTELLCKLNHKGIGIPLKMSNKLSDPVQIYSKAFDVDQMEFNHKKQQTQTSKIQEETSPVCDVDMELTSDIKWNEMCYPEVVNRFVGNMELSRKMPQMQTSNPLQISSHTGIVSDVELRSGMKQNEMSSAVQMSKYISDEELTCQWPQKQISKPMEVPSHTGKETDTELTIGINWKETRNAVGVKRYVSDMEQRSERPQKQMVVHQIYLSSDDNTSDMELTNEIKQIGMSREVEVKKYVNDMELTREMTKEMSCPVDISSHGEVSDMELTNGTKLKKKCNAVDVDRYDSDMELTNERLQMQLLKPIGVSRHVGDVSNMDLKRGRKQKEICNAVQLKLYASGLDLANKRAQNSTELSSNGNVGDTELTNQIKKKQVCKGEEVRKYVNNMELTSEMTQKEMSCPVDISSHGDDSVMKLTSGMKWEEIENAVEVNRCVSVKELPSERPQNETSNLTGLSSFNHTDADMKLTHAVNWKDTYNSVKMNRYVSDMALTSEGLQKEIFSPLDASNHGNVSDMELTNRMKWKTAVDKNRYASDMALKSEGPQKEIFNPLDASNHGNVSDMELTSEMKWKKTNNTAEMNRYASEMGLTSEGPQKEIFSPPNASNHPNISDMELTSRMNLKKTHNAVEMNRYVSDMALRSEGPKREIFNPLDVSNHANVSDMELTSGMKWEKTHSAVEMNRCVSDMSFTNEGPQKEIFNPLDASNHANVELTSGMKLKKTHNAVEMNRYISEMSLTNRGPQREIFNPLDVSNHANVSDMELTSGMKWEKTHNTVEMNRCVSALALMSEGPQREIFNPLDASNHGNISDMELTSGMKLKKTCKLGEVNQPVTDMEVRNEKRLKQTFIPIEMSSCNNVSNMELRSDEKGKEIYNVGDVADMEQSNRRESARSAVCADLDELILRNEVIQMNMDLSGVNLKGINGQLDVFCTYAKSSNTENIEFVNQEKDVHTDTHSETKKISGIPTILEVPKLSFNQISNIDGKKLSKHREMDDVAGMSHQTVNIKQSDTVIVLHTNGSEDNKQQSEPEVLINPCGDKNTDKACQSDHGQAKTSLRDTFLSEECTVEPLENSEKFQTQDSSLTLVNQVEGQYCLPFSKVSLASTKGRCCEQGISEVEGINESGSYKSRERQVENRIPSETSAPAVGLNSSNPLNMKKLGKISNECDTLKFNQGSVNRSLKNTAGHSQGKYDLENLDSSSNKLTQVSQTCPIDNRITKENLTMHQPLSEGSTYTFCTTGAIQELAIGFDSVGNAASSNTDSVDNGASHDIQEVEYASKQVHEKTHSQDSSAKNTQMFKCHNSNSLLLEELDGKQGLASTKPASYECLEARDLHLQTPPELQAFQTVEQPRSVLPAVSTEPVEINQNLSYLEIENTPIPEEMEFNIIRDLSHETDESYKKPVECVSLADECVQAKVSMISNESAMLGNSQSTEQNYKNRTSLLEEMKNNESIMNEPITRGQKHSPIGTPVKPFSKQMCEHSKPKKLRKDANEDDTTASVQIKIKEEELRLVINCKLVCSMSDVMACLISI